MVKHWYDMLCVSNSISPIKQYNFTALKGIIPITISMLSEVINEMALRLRNRVIWWFLDNNCIAENWINLIKKINFSYETGKKDDVNPTMELDRIPNCRQGGLIGILGSQLASPTSSQPFYSLQSTLHIYKPFYSWFFYQAVLALGHSFEDHDAFAWFVFSDCFVSTVITNLIY